MIRKTVIITGASGDIGYSIAKKFASCGYDIFATFNKGNIEKVKKLSNDYDVKIFTKKMNICLYNDIEEAFKEAKKVCSYIDCLVCNAGVSLDERLLSDTSIEDVKMLIDTNFTGTILCNREILKYFVQQKHGNIINISSIYGLYGGSCESVYSATKAGIIGLTKALAQECGNFNIRVNAVAPGFIETKMTSHFNDEEKTNIVLNTPLQRLGTCKDVANAVYFLASNDASFITGQTILISGGAIKYN